MDTVEVVEVVKKKKWLKRKSRFLYIQSGSERLEMMAVHQVEY